MAQVAASPLHYHHSLPMPHPPSAALKEPFYKSPSMMFLLSLLPQVTVTVDGVYTDRWITSGSFSVLASSTVFVGGSEPSYRATEDGGKVNGNNWVGCLRKVSKNVFSGKTVVFSLFAFLEE